MVAAAAGTTVGVMAGNEDAEPDSQAQEAEPKPAEKVDAGEVDDVTVDPSVSDVDLSIGGDDVDVIVHNGFGRDIPEVLMELNIDEPGGEFPKVGAHGGDEFCDDAARSKGVSKAKGESECERLQKSGEEWCRPKPEFDEPGVQQSQCLRTLHPGENRYLYDMGLRRDPDEYEAAQLRGYPDLKVTVELSIDGEVFAEAESAIPSPWGP